MALRKNAGFPECRGLGIRERFSSSSVVVLALGEGSIPREPRKALGEEFLFFSFFAPYFFGDLPVLFKTSCSNLRKF